VGNYHGVPIDAFAPLCHHRSVIQSAGEGDLIRLRISILASGSSGNATLIETEHTSLLVDAGIGKKEIQRRFFALGIEPPTHVDGILLSHEHTDHTSGLPQMMREWGATAYLTAGTRREIVRAMKESSLHRMAHTVEIEAGHSFMVGEMGVTPFQIPHDAADPVGFTIRAEGVKVAIVTDLGYLPELVKHHLREADFLVLESNHDLEMLKVGPYPWQIKQRVMSRTGHLSNHVVSEYLGDADGFDARARHVVLGHISENNNNPILVELSATQALESRTAGCEFSGNLHIASQHIPLGPFVF
jgi:phosphoribosyl 1,2-cyclic phosphodiesterase